MTEPSHAFEHFVGRLRPHERLGLSVGDFDVPADGRLQFARAAVDAVPQLFLGQGAEPALDEIDQTSRTTPWWPQGALPPGGPIPTVPFERQCLPGLKGPFAAIRFRPWPPFKTAAEQIAA